MKRNYCIASPLSIPDDVHFDTVQWTLNNRIFPSQRKTVRLLSSHPLPCDYFVHYDFIYIASRYALFAPHVQKAIVAEVASIINYANQDPHLKGIIMHCDFPLKSKVLDSKDESYILNEYKAGIWDSISVLTAARFSNNILTLSLELFGSHLCSVVKSFPIKVYLENTTKVGPDHVCSTQNLLDFVLQTSYPCFGLCVDTEHYFAVEGSFPSQELLSKLPSDQLLVHLNAIPKEVLPGSGLDRHSHTTLKECSQNSLLFYQEYVSYLENRNIPYIREVHTETMYREIQQLNL